MLTIKEAAQLAGRSKQALHAAIQAGKLSANKDDQGIWRIDPDEVARVYGKSEQPACHVEHVADNRLEVATQRIRELEGALMDARQERDRWHEIAERLTRALPEGQGRAIEPRKGWWARLLGR